MDFKCALVTGGGGGIRKALAQYFLPQGKKVTMARKTESKLQQACKDIGAAAYYVLETGAVSEIPTFVCRVVSEHPKLDSLVNNAAYRGPCALIKRLILTWQGKSYAVVINASSILRFSPFSLIDPVHNGTKAWVHFWSVNLSKNPNGQSIEEFMAELSKRFASGDEMIRSGMSLDIIRQ
ncbi:NAD(P)-binding protein [Xylaria arbuscula]|nr:NAD(P)-binding protein [Xylaria arbuscula]